MLMSRASEVRIPRWDKSIFEITASDESLMKAARERKCVRRFVDSTSLGTKDHICRYHIPLSEISGAGLPIIVEEQHPVMDDS
jgi:hypothetical protein